MLCILYVHRYIHISDEIFSVGLINEFDHKNSTNNKLRRAVGRKLADVDAANSSISKRATTVLVYERSSMQHTSVNTQILV